LADTTVVITGASSGLGRATALLAAEEGARVVNADVQRDPRSGGTPTDEYITESGGEATFVETDATDIGEVNAVMDEAIDRFGSLDVVVNNAG
ncbi:3-ketoacyl-ACP reductase, partial [Enterococcus hirae]